MQELQGRVAVVTGAASGIGKALATRFAAEGMSVVLADVDDARLEDVRAELTARGSRVAAVRCDTSLADSVANLAEQAVSAFGAVHVVCNNAGVIGAGDPWSGPMSAWDWPLAVNLYGVIHGIRTFLPMLQAQGEGHIVNTASMAGLTAFPGAAPYSVSKHGVVALSEALFLELLAAGSPVGVSVLCPGFVRTDLMHAPWIERLGDRPPEPSDPMGATAFDGLRRGIDGGMAPEDVADHVVAAIRADRFWILTHRASRRDPVERMRRAAAQQNPRLGPTSRFPRLSRVRRILKQRIPARRR